MELGPSPGHHGYPRSQGIAHTHTRERGGEREGDGRGEREATCEVMPYVAGAHCGESNHAIDSELRQRMGWVRWPLAADSSTNCPKNIKMMSLGLTTYKLGADRIIICD